MELTLTHRLDLSDLVDERCLGCPAVLAGELDGISRLAGTVCGFAFLPAVRDAEEAGCRKGPLDPDKLFVPIIRQ